MNQTNEQHAEPMMRAAVHDRYGPPSVMHVRDVARPVPSPDQVLVQVHAATMNRTDTGYRSGTPWVARLFSGLRRPKYRVSGMEFAGVVVEVGSAVTSFDVGDRVFGANVHTFGSHAEYMPIVESAAIARIPDEISFADAAAVCDGIILAITYLRKVELGPHHRILINGATGSIGSAAVQLAKHQFGAHVTAVCTSATSDLVRSLGADEVIDREATDFARTGETYDIVFDAVGKRSFRECRRALVPRGVYLNTELGFLWQNPVIGLLTQKLPMRRMYFPLPVYRRSGAEFAAEVLANGSYRAVVDRVWPLDQIVAAAEYVEAGQKVGNVVFEVARRS